MAVTVTSAAALIEHLVVIVASHPFQWSKIA
jgi:hypothetical protein